MNQIALLNVNFLIIKKIKEVLRAQIEAYKKVFVDASRNVDKLDTAMSKYFGVATQVNETISILY
jgi:hypothetical protein